jgi:F-type H+-transporting ATPase subunit delta
VSSNESLTDRYAAALIAAAREEGCEGRVFDDMRLVDECIVAEPALFRQLGVPSFDRHKKAALLETAFGKTVHELTLRFLFLLIRRSRFGLLRSLYPALCRLRDRELQVKKLIVTSASQLSVEHRENLERRLMNRFGKNCSFSYEIDGRLIGGFTVALDGIEIDCSVRSGLNELKKELSAL